jgi:four helix bundle protein
LSRAARDGVGTLPFAHGARGIPEITMLRIHDVMLDAITTMCPLIRSIERNDRDLASQLKRAASSVALNLAEGSGSFGGVRTQRYRTALGSARETMSSLLVAERFGYVEAVPKELVAQMNRVIGTLVRVAA